MPRFELSPEVDDLADSIAQEIHAQFSGRLEDVSVARAVVDEVLCQLVEERDLSLARLNHVGWQSRENHDLHELQEDEDGSWNDGDWIPVFTVGRGAIGLPPVAEP